MKLYYKYENEKKPLTPIQCYYVLDFMTILKNTYNISSDEAIKSMGLNTINDYAPTYETKKDFVERVNPFYVYIQSGTWKKYTKEELLNHWDMFKIIAISNDYKTIYFIFLDKKTITLKINDDYLNIPINYRYNEEFEEITEERINISILFITT